MYRVGIICKSGQTRGPCVIVTRISHLLDETDHEALCSNMVAILTVRLDQITFSILDSLSAALLPT